MLCPGLVVQPECNSVGYLHREYLAPIFLPNQSILGMQIGKWDVQNFLSCSLCKDGFKFPPILLSSIFVNEITSLLLRLLLLIDYF